MESRKLSEVRNILANKKIDALIVLSCDAHQSEYVCGYDQRRFFITGFDGSAGTAVILQSKALLWTDGRYFLQAEQQLEDGWTLMKQGLPGVPELADYLIENLKSGQKVGVDSKLISYDYALNIMKKLSAHGINLVKVDENPIDMIWTEERPAFPQSKIFPQSIEYSGKSHNEKIKDIQTFLAKNDAYALVVSMLDEIAWLFNIRGSDVDYNPVAISYAIVTQEDAIFFIDPAKVDDKCREHLGSAVEIKSYSDIFSYLTLISRRGKIIIDPTHINWEIAETVETAKLEKTNPIALSKSLKNPVELSGFRDCHVRDGVALTAFIHWLEKKVQSSPHSITEYEAAEALEEFRRKMDRHMGPSFPTIAGFGSNGAIIHYRPEKETSKTIGTEAAFLLDSGAQYLDGTTDVTRFSSFIDNNLLENNLFLTH